MNPRLEVGYLDISVEGLIGLYTENTDPYSLGLQIGLSSAEEEALELEAENLLETGVASRWDGREYFFEATAYEHMSRRRINTLKRTIEKKRPDFVAAIKEAARASNNIYVIVGLAELEDYPYPAVAIIENLAESGEIDFFGDE